MAIREPGLMMPNAAKHKPCHVYKTTYIVCVSALHIRVTVVYR